MKMISMLVALYLLAFTSKTLAVSYNKSDNSVLNFLDTEYGADYSADLVERLAENLYGPCKYAFAGRLESEAFLEQTAQDRAQIEHTPASISMQVYVYPPGLEEQERERLLPRTLTGANTLLGTSSRAVRWGNLPQTMWQIPVSHPRQRKQYCVDLSRQAGEAVHAFYSKNISRASPFYVLQVKGPVLVEERGLLATKCGWVQPVEACETMYKFIGRRWYAACQANITAIASAGKGKGAGAGAGAGKGESGALSWETMVGDSPLPLPNPAPTYPIPAESTIEGESEESVWNRQTLVNSATSHTCFPAEVVLPGRRQRAEGVQPYTIYQQVHRVREVFVVVSQWDNNYHHFIVDCLSRLVRHHRWLQRNPEVFIHIRAFERLAKKDKFVAGGQQLRRGLWRLLGIDPRRVIYGHVMADTAWLARSTRCNEPLSHAMELRLLSAELIRAATQQEQQHNAAADDVKIDPKQFIDVGGFGIPVEADYNPLSSESVPEAKVKAESVLVQGKEQEKTETQRRSHRRLSAKAADDFVDDAGDGSGHAMPSHSSSPPLHGVDTQPPADTLVHRPLLLIQQRVCTTAEECDSTWREWNETTVRRVVRAFRTQYGDNYRIAVASSDNARLMSCIACQIRLYRQADVLVGLHGAGLTNIMFMKPGAVLVELTGEFDGRMAPVCGYHGPLAAAFGIHHYVFMWEWKMGGRQPPSDVELAELALGSYHFGLAVGAK